MNIPHPAGGGRQQRDPEGLTILSARSANAEGSAVVVVTAEAGAIAVSEADAPALWEKLQAWAAAGGVIAPLPVAVPASVTVRQARRALLAAGLLDAVQGWVDSEAPPEARIDWEYASTFDRASPLVAAAGAALGLSSAQIDDLFIAAAAL